MTKNKVTSIAKMTIDIFYVLYSLLSFLVLYFLFADKEYFRLVVYLVIYLFGTISYISFARKDWFK